MIVDSIKNGPYVRRMIATPGEPDLPVPVPESFHEQTDEELTENDIKRMDADDQAIQTILLGLPEDVYAAVDSCETAKEIWECVQQMMKGFNIGEHEKKAKLFNEWEKFTSTEGESIESYYHRFMQLINGLKRNKHFPENIASNLKAERLAKSHDPLALMAHSQNSFNFSTADKDQSSSSTHSQQSFPINNKYNPQLSLNKNFMKPPMTSLEDINDPTEAMNATLILFSKSFQLTAPTKNNQRTSSNPHNRLRVLEMGIKPGATTVEDWVTLLGIALPDQGEGMLLIFRPSCSLLKKEAGIQLQAKEFDFMAAAGDLDKIEEVNANYILMANLQHASTSGTQLDKAPIYDTDGSAEVNMVNCNM
nr:hypothetical protein [Tanacetum cinerariifolium]